MPILDLFRVAIAGRGGKIDPLRVAQAIGNFANTVESFGSEHAQLILTNILAPWAFAIAQKAPQKWLLPEGVQPSCAFEQAGGTCGQYAIGGCHLCGRPICLGHAMVSGDATLVCWTCMRVAAKHTTRWEPSQVRAGGKVKDDLGWAYDLLELDRDATDAEVKRAFKERIAQFHPDRHPEATEKEQKVNGGLVRTLKRAYDVICEARAATKRPRK